MKNKATRLFLKRLPNNGWVRPIDRVRYVQTEGHLANDCLENALKMVELDNSRYQVVTGWCIGRRDKRGNTAIINHYWTFDHQTGEHIDTTPFAEALHTDYDYVADHNIQRLLFTDAVSHYLSNGIMPSLMYDRDELFTCLTDNNHPYDDDTPYDPGNLSNWDFDALIREHYPKVEGDEDDDLLFYNQLMFVDWLSWQRNGWAIDDAKIDEIAEKMENR